MVDFSSSLGRSSLPLSLSRGSHHSQSLSSRCRSAKTLCAHRSLFIKGSRSCCFLWPTPTLFPPSPPPPRPSPPLFSFQHSNRLRAPGSRSPSALLLSFLPSPLLVSPLRFPLSSSSIMLGLLPPRALFDARAFKTEHPYKPEWTSEGDIRLASIAFGFTIGFGGWSLRPGPQGLQLADVLLRFPLEQVFSPPGTPGSSLGSSLSTRSCVGRRS